MLMINLIITNSYSDFLSFEAFEFRSKPFVMLIDSFERLWTELPLLVLDSQRRFGKEKWRKRFKTKRITVIEGLVLYVNHVH